MRKAILLSACWLAACAGVPQRFPASGPLWEDHDQRPFSGEPEEYYSPLAWDAADQTIFRPLSRFFAVDPGEEAMNVNALDEVPNSSWFRNRIGWFPVSPEELRRGPCDPPHTDPLPPWKVTGAKPNGANPGFVIKDDKGDRYLVKFDGEVQGPRATSADAIVSKIYWAAGYNTPCNQIVFFDRSILTIDPEARGENERGDEEPLTQSHLDVIFDKALRLPDGRYRASTSKFLPGKPLGPFTYQGTRDGDPNDVVDHEDRRELRGAYVLAAWTHHFDAREQNTLAMWVETSPGKGYVQHDLIDFGDCFGSIWEPPALGRRIGNAYYLDISYVLEDFVTFGTIRRSWDWARFGSSGRVFGYYDVERFEPDAWRPGYPNPAFGRMTERDAAWMARIVAQFTDDHLAALVREARFRNSFLEQELARILRGRRDRILERYLSRLSPLSHPVVIRRGGRTMLCLRDLALFSRMVSRDERAYEAATWSSGTHASLPVVASQGEQPEVCVVLSASASASPADYLVVDVTAKSSHGPSSGPARVHLYRRTEGAYRVAGLERPFGHDPPEVME